MRKNLNRCTVHILVMTEFDEVTIPIECPNDTENQAYNVHTMQCIFKVDACFTERSFI